FRRLSGRLRALAMDRLGSRSVRAAALHGPGDRPVGCRHCVDAGTLAAAHHFGPRRQRRLRVALPDGLHRLCDDHRAGRALLGGGFGPALGGLAGTVGSWPACAALVVAMLLLMAGIVLFAWARRVPDAPAM